MSLSPAAAESHHFRPIPTRAGLGLNIPKHPVRASDAAPCQQSHAAQPKTQARVLLNLAPGAVAAPGSAGHAGAVQGSSAGGRQLWLARAGSGVLAWAVRAEKPVAANAGPRGNAEYSAGSGGLAPEKH